MQIAIITILSISGARINILFIVKVKTIMLIKCNRVSCLSTIFFFNLSILQYMHILQAQTS